MARLTIRFGFPIGSLQAKSSELFEKIGRPIEFKDRVYKVELVQKDLLIIVYFMRPLMMPLSIKRGIIDAGIFGLDCVENAGLEDCFEEVTRLNFSKTTNDDVELALFAKWGFKIKKMRGKTIWVGTEFDVLTENKLKQFYPSYKFKVEHVDQTVETYVIAGQYHMGVTVVESGATLRQNKLKKVKRIMKSHTGLWANKKSMQEEAFRDKITYLGDKLRGALRGEKNEMLKMNVGNKDILEKVLAHLEEQKSISLLDSEKPTVSGLAGGGYAIEVVVLEDQKFDLIYDLKDMGVTKIIVADRIKSILY